MFHGLSTVAFALAASLTWGAGDFSGGLATRRAQVLSVVVGAYAVGLIMLIALALVWSEPFPTTLDLMWGSVAGLAGAVGLVAFYQALAVGRMGIVAPIAAMLSAALPVLFGAFFEGLPGPLQLIGFVLLEVSSSLSAESVMVLFFGHLRLQGSPLFSFCLLLYSSGARRCYLKSQFGLW